MNKYTIELSEEARQDLIEIARYIKYELQEPNTSSKLIKKIQQAIYNLANNPYIYSIIDNDYIKKLELRKLVVDNYLVFYRVLDNTFKIQIARIMYGRRNWQDILK